MPYEPTIERLALSYEIPLIDWGRGGDSLLLTTGAGLMMATCDVIPRIRWAADIGGGKPYPALGDFLCWANRLVPGLVIGHFWFSVTAPEPIRLALGQVEERKLLVRSNLPLGVGLSFGSFRDLIEAAADRVVIQFGVHHAGSEALG